MAELEGLYREGVGVDTEVSGLILKQTPEHSQADFGMAMFPLAKAMRQNPAEIAKQVADRLNNTNHPWLRVAVAEGPYANIELDTDRFGRDVVKQVLAQGADYGKENIGQGRRVVIDMSSPNIAKRMSVGHLRSTIIGDSIARIYRATGHEVIRDNHIGDWGTQFGKQIAGIDMWSSEEELQNAEDPVGLLQKTYVRYEAEIFNEKIDGLVEALNNRDEDAWRAVSQLFELSGRGDIAPGNITSDIVRELIKSNEEAVEDDPIEKQKKKVEKHIGGYKSALEDKGRAYFARLEAGDPKIRRMWQTCVDVSLKEFEKTYEVLGIEFEEVFGESYYEQMLQDVMEEVRESGIGTVSEGALIVDMKDKKLGVQVVETADGRSLYITRDIATAEYRQNEMGADAQIYVVGDDQKLYFQQLFEILKRLGHPIGENSTHVYFGMVSLKEGKMSTRKGRVILLKDVIEEGLNRADALLAEQEIFQANPELRADTAKKVAVGALKWNDLYQGADRSIVFDWDTALNFKGESGPYVQYSAVRINSIIEKAGTDTDSVKELPVDESEEVYQHDTERELLKAIARYSSVLTEAHETNSPNKVASYAFQVAKLYSQFYDSVSVLNAETEAQKSARLRLSAATSQVITNSLDLLGIEVPQRM